MDNVIEGKVILDSSQLDSASVRASQNFLNIGQSAVTSGYFIQNYADQSVQAAITQDQLAAAAAAAAANIPKVIPPAEGAGFSFTEMARRAKEAAAEVLESMNLASEGVTRFAETTRLGTGTAIASFSALGAVLGGAAIIGILGEMTEKAKQNVASLNQLATATGEDVRQLVGFRQVLIENDVPVENLNQTILKLSRAMLEARDPSSRQAEAFRELGVSTEGWSTKLPGVIDTLLAIADHLQHSTKNSQDLGNASQLLGRNVVALAAALRTNGEELRDNISQHREYGEAILNSKEAEDELTKTEARLAEQWNTLSTSALPGVVFALQLAHNGWLRFKEAGEIAGREVAFFAEVAEISFRSSGNAIRGAALEALALAAAITGNVSAAVDFQLRANAAFEKSQEQFKLLPGVLKETAKQVTDIANETQKKINEIWSKPLEIRKPDDSDNQDFQNKKQIDKVRAAKEQELSVREEHDLSILRVEVDHADAMEKAGLISEETRVNTIKEALSREMAIRIDYANRKIALYANDPDSVDRVAKLEGDKKKAIDDSLAGRLKADDALTASKEKQKDEEEKFSLFVEKQNQQRQFTDEVGWTKVENTAAIHYLKQQTAAFRANQLLEVAELEHQAKMLQYEENRQLAVARIEGASVADQIAIVRRFDAEISAMSAKAEALRTSQVNPEDDNAPVEKAQIAIDAERKREAQAESTARKIDEINRSGEQNFRRFANTVSSQFDSAFRSVITGSQTAQQAFGRMLAGMTTDLVANLSKMALRWAAHYAEHLIMHETTNAAIVSSDAAAEATSTSISASAAFKKLAHSATVAAGKAYSAFADIPIVGPALGAAAAAATFVGVMAFQSFISAEGGAVLGGSGALAQLHPREMVLPADLSQGIQRMVSSGGNPSDGNSEPRQSLALHYYAPQTTSREQMKKDAKQMWRYIESEMRKGRMSPNHV